MVEPPFPLPATPLGPASAAMVAWRVRGTLYLTVVVKATFALVSEGRMSLIDPDPITSGEPPAPGAVGGWRAGDLAPYLEHAEVSLTGRAPVPPRFSQPYLRVQLAVVRDRVTLLDKHLGLSVAHHLGDPPSVTISGMEPIAREWPLRTRWLEDTDPRRRRSLGLDLPDVLQPGFFQTSQEDLRLDTLRGDEWLLLGGMIQESPMLRTQLPAATGVARLYRWGQPAPRAGEPVSLRADTLRIDIDRRRCSIVWRGRAQLKSDTELSFLRVVAGIEQAGQPVAWKDPFTPEEPLRRKPPRAQPSPESPLSRTVDLTSEEAAKLAASPAVPFQAVRGSPVAHAIARGRSADNDPPKQAGSKRDAGVPSFAQTMIPSVEAAEQMKAGSRPATPFEASSAKDPREVRLKARNFPTAQLPPDVIARLNDAPVMPFLGAPPSPREEAPLRPLPPATPFERAQPLVDLPIEPPPPVLRSTPIVLPEASYRPLGMSEEADVTAPPRASPPPAVAIEPTAEPIAIDPMADPVAVVAAESPKTLGAQFRAALTIARKKAGSSHPT